MTTAEKYKAIKRRLGITDAQVAEWFGYSSGMSFANSARKEEVTAGIVALFEHIGENQIQFFKIESEEDSK